VRTVPQPTEPPRQAVKAHRHITFLVLPIVNCKHSVVCTVIMLLIYN